MSDEKCPKWIEVLSNEIEQTCMQRHKRGDVPYLIQVEFTRQLAAKDADNVRLRAAIEAIGMCRFVIGYHGSGERWYWAKPDDHIVNPSQFGWRVAADAALAGLAAAEK